jgi:hypothetical protein
VLLLDDGAEAYTPEDFANLFAQVTTSAQKLDDLHNEWLTFAFALGRYSRDAGHAPEHAASMRTVAQLCAAARLSDRRPNPFHNAVHFNHFYEPQQASLGGFSFTCIEMRDLVFSNYNSAATDPLEPDVVSDEIGKAYLSLIRLVSTPEESVFFGVSHEEPAHGQPYMQAAFIAGVLTHLREHGIPDDWEDVLGNSDFMRRTGTSQRGRERSPV